MYFLLHHTHHRARFSTQHIVSMFMTLAYIHCLRIASRYSFSSNRSRYKSVLSRSFSYSIANLPSTLPAQDQLPCLGKFSRRGDGKLDARTDLTGLGAYSNLLTLRCASSVRSGRRAILSPSSSAFYLANNKAASSCSIAQAKCSSRTAHDIQTFLVDNLLLRGY